MKHAKYQDEINNYTVDECYNHHLWPKDWSRNWLVESTTIDGERKFCVVIRTYGLETNRFWIADKPEITARTALKSLLEWRYVPPNPTNEDRKLALDLLCIFNNNFSHSYKQNMASELIAEYREKVTNNDNKN